MTGMSGTPRGRYEVRGVDTYELQTATFRERAYFPVESFDDRDAAIARAELEATKAASADPNLCDVVEVLDRSEDSVIWRKTRP